MLWHYEGVRWWSGGWAGSLKHLHHTATLLTTPSGHCRLDTGHQPDQTQTKQDIFCSRSLPSDCRKKCSCDKPPCLCSNGYALCVLRSIELKRERAILPVFCKPICWFRTWFGEINFPCRTARDEQAASRAHNDHTNVGSMEAAGVSQGNWLAHWSSGSGWPTQGLRPPADMQPMCDVVLNGEVNIMLDD